MSSGPSAKRTRRAVVLVLLCRAPDHPQTAQGLRAAVGYVAAGLRVRVGLCGACQAWLGSDGRLLPEAKAAETVGRALTLLELLRHPVVALGDGALESALRESDGVVVW